MGFLLYDRNEYYDVLNSARRQAAQADQYKNLLAPSPEEVIDRLNVYGEKHPELDASTAIGLSILGVPPEYNAVKEINQASSTNRVYNEAKIWKELQNNFQYDHLEDNMKMSIGDLFTAGLFPGGAKPGDVQYGVWGFAALDAFFQTFGPGGSGKWSLGSLAVNAITPGQPMQVGRSVAYLRELREYNTLLKDRYTPAQAQKQLSIDLSGTKIANLGEELSTLESLEQQIDMIQEAHRMGGEPVLANMLRQVWRGEPLNFDRATKITLESVKAEKTPYYIELTTKYGMSGDEARDFIYKHIGSPLKGTYDASTKQSNYAFDEGGEIHYTSAFNPNKINFFAGRAKQRYFWNTTQQDYFRPEWADRNILMEYSPGKVSASEIYEPGTKAFNTLSGLLDASHQILPDLLAANFVRGSKGLMKGFRGVNQAMDLVDQGKLVKGTAFSKNTIQMNPRKLADNVLDEVGPRIDGATGSGKFDDLVDSSGQLLTNKFIWKDKTGTRKALRKLRKDNALFGRVPRFFQATKDEILNQPTNVEFFKALAKSDIDDLHHLSNNPVTRNMPAQIQLAIAEETDWMRIQKMFDDMISSSGFTIINDAGQKVPYTLPGKLLPKTGSLTFNRLLQTTGIKPDASFRTFGSWAGQKSRRVRESVFPLRKSKEPYKLIEEGNEIIDTMDALGDTVGKVSKIEEMSPAFVIETVKKAGLPEFEKFLGFSSNFNSSYNPYYRKLLGVVPDMGIPLNNLQVGYKQLSSHLQINGYDSTTASKILKEYLDIDPMQKTKYRDFAYKQASRDMKLVRAKGGNWEYVADYVEKMFEGQKKMKIYATDADNNILPNIGSNYKGYELNEVGEAAADGKLIQTMTGSLFSEMQDNIAPLLDYRLIDRAIKPLYKAYPEGKYIKASPLTDAKQFLKYKKQHSKWGKNVDEMTPNPFDDGILNVKRLESTFVNNLMSFYTRNIFKPFVLTRFAFFTRVFLEEQARIAVKGLSSIYTKPWEFAQWVFAHNPNSKAGNILSKLPGVRTAKYNDYAVDFLMQEEVIEAMQKTFRVSDMAGGANVRRNKYLEYLGKRTSEMNQKEITIGAYHELRQLRNDPIAAAVAKFGYGTDELSKWISSSAGKEARLQFIRYKGGDAADFIDETSRALDQHLQFLESRIRIISGGDFDRTKDAIVSAKTGKYTYALRPSSKTGNAQIRKMIGDGELAKFGTDGTKADDMVEFFSYEDKFLKKFKKDKILNQIEQYYKKGEGIDPGTLTVTKKIVDDADQNTLGKIEDAMEIFYQTIFDNLMTKPIGILNRSTTFKQFRWIYLQDRFKDFDKGLRAKFLQEAKDAAVPKDVINELEGLSRIWKPGKISDYEVMNTESKAYALAGVKELLYDTRKRHTLSDKLVNIFPFVEVWFEVFQTWGKLFGENPYVLRKGHVSLRGATAANTMGNSSDDGWISPDPRNPERDVFVYPFGGFMSNVIFDDELISDGDERTVQMSPRGQLQGINLLGQGFVPGPNSFVAFGLDRLIPKIENASTKLGAKYGWGNDVEKFVFGDFPPPERFSEAAFPLSPVWNKLRAASLNPDDFDVLTDNNKEIERMRAAQTIEIWRWGVGAGEPKRLYEKGKLDAYITKLYPNKNPANINQGDIEDAYLEYAKEKSGTLFMFQFIYQQFGPAGFKPEFFIEDEQGQMWGQAVLYEEYVRIREKNNQNDVATYNEFLELYGVEHPYLLSPRTQSEAGKKPASVRVQEFQKNNPEIFDNLDVSGYYLNIDNPYEEKSYEELVKYKSALTPDQYRRGVNDTIGFFRYKTFTQKIDDLETLSSTQKTIINRSYRNELKLALPGFQAEEYGITNPPSTQDIFTEMKEKWLINPAILELEAGKGFKEIMVAWNLASQLSRNYSRSNNPDWWLSSEDARAKALRIYVYNEGNKVIEKYPDFWPVWTGVMLKLYRDDQEILEYFPER